MVKKMIEIDVPDGMEVERVRQFGLSSGHIDLAVTLRPEWQWPEWLTAEWIAKDEDGRWFAYQDEPIAKGYCYLPSKGCVAPICLFTAFEPPPCDDWKKSKRRNPNVT